MLWLLRAPLLRTEAEDLEGGGGFARGSGATYGCGGAREGLRVMNACAVEVAEGWAGTAGSGGGGERVSHRRVGDNDG